MGDARATTRRTKQSEHGQRNASPLTAFSSRQHSACKGTFARTSEQSRLITELSAKETCSYLQLRYLSRLQQLLLKELSYLLLRQRISAAAPCKRTGKRGVLRGQTDGVEGGARAHARLGGCSQASPGSVSQAACRVACGAASAVDGAPAPSGLGRPCFKHPSPIADTATQHSALNPKP